MQSSGVTDKPPLRIKLPAPVADIYRAVAELERLYPGCKFTPDGHLVGSIGEGIAAEHFGLKLHGKSKPATTRSMPRAMKSRSS